MLIEDEITPQSEPDNLGSSKDWTNAVNRGGLVIINDEAYRLFTAIETIIRTHYNVHNIKNITDGVKSTLLAKVEEDEDVQFHWCIITADMCSKVSKLLLNQITEMWITIRGFSFTKCYMELYKKRETKITQRSKGLRKELFTSRVL